MNYMNLTMEQSRKKVNRNILATILMLLLFFLIILIKNNYFDFYRINGISMMETLHNGDVVFLEKKKRIKRFDIIVARIGNETVIKRVLGLPNETIEYNNNNLYINDSVISNNYNFGKTEDFERVAMNEQEYYIIGDNRENSIDSRVYGPINSQNIIGVVNFRLYPIFQNLKN